jgi:hypothetical protein
VPAMNRTMPSGETGPCIFHLRVSPAKQENKSRARSEGRVPHGQVFVRGVEDRTSLPKAGVEPKAKRLNSPGSILAS